MGKVEILTLIAGVVLSIALALIVVPMFSNSDELVKKQKINQELIAVKNAINMINNVESSKLPTSAGALSSDGYLSLGDYLKGMDLLNASDAKATTGITKIKSANGLGTYAVTYLDTDNITITYTKDNTNVPDDLTKLFTDIGTLSKVCNGSTFATGDIVASTITCDVKK